MPAIKKGAGVRQIVRIIEGTVADIRYDADKGTFTYLVDYKLEDGTPSQRWFDQTEVEEIIAPEEV